MLRTDAEPGAPLVTVDLDGIEELSYAALDEIMQALSADNRVRVGVRSSPLPTGYTGPAWWVVNAMSTTIVPALPAVPRAHRETPMEQSAGLVATDDPGRTIAEIRSAVTAQPEAARILDGLLRQNVDLPVLEGLRNERAATGATGSAGATGPTGATTALAAARLDLPAGDAGGGRVRISFRDSAGGAAQALRHPDGPAAAGPGPCRADRAPVARPSRRTPRDRRGARGHRATTPRGTAVRSAPDPVEASLAALLHQYRDQVLVTLAGRVSGPVVELVAFTDEVVAAPDTLLSWPDLADGRLPANGGTVSLTRRIGRWRTTAMILAGLEVDAATAYRWNLVDRIGTA